MVWSERRLADCCGSANRYIAGWCIGIENDIVEVGTVDRAIGIFERGVHIAWQDMLSARYQRPGFGCGIRFPLRTHQAAIIADHHLGCFGRANLERHSHTISEQGRVVDADVWYNACRRRINDDWLPSINWR